ncbi:MAG: dihydroorotate dehydrogenase electron transfer subunit [Lachnospiraceae bacterium]|jgi:dihydroorotate dehydrogenase electron transfer subunit|nr:dihydroorotate dehydrogenase electron transfer subunit [Lachnospiraceae bacterium]
MAKIIENYRVSKDFFLMRVALGDIKSEDVRMGQFFMLRSGKNYPLLSRPISVFDVDSDSVSFLYQVVGEGTKIFSELKAHDNIEIDRPHGNGFPSVSGRIALVGGGVGVAPLYFTAKQLSENSGFNGENDIEKDLSDRANTFLETSIDIYLGFREEPALIERYEDIANKVIVNLGGFITDDIDTREYDYILSCGPTPMMKALYNKCKEQNSKAKLYVSMENRMACGIGACLVCTCETTKGNKRACKDGPVFLANEVFEIE